MNLGVGTCLKLGPTDPVGVWGEPESESKVTHPFVTLGGHLPAPFLGHGIQSLAFLLDQVITQSQEVGSKGGAFREGACRVNLSSSVVGNIFVCLRFLSSWAVVSAWKPDMSCSVEQMVRCPECGHHSPSVS